MSAPIIECPICMDEIDVTKNSVVTDCGHTFHCSCLMQNAAHNGFGCPYCRTTMATEPPLEDEDDESDEGVLDLFIQEMSNNSLTSFRMFTQRLDGEEPEEEPEEEEDWETDDDEEEEEEETDDVAPDSAYMATKLLERGITYEDLVKNILFGEHSNLGDRYEEYDRRSGEVFGQFRAIITRYTHSRVDVPAVAPPVVPAPVAAQPFRRVVTPTPIPEVAETKSLAIQRHREFMYHV